MMGRRGLLQAVLDGLRGQRPRIVVLGLRRLLADQRGLDGGQHLVELLRVRRLPLFHLHNVVAKLALHDLCVADFLGEEGVVELRHHAAALGKAQFTALVLAAGIVGVFLGEIRKVRAALNLLENPLSLGLGRGIGLGVRARSHLDENVPRTRLLRRRVLGLVRGKILLNLLLAGLRNPAGQFIGGKGKVGDLALFRHPRGIARGVLLEESRKLPVRGIDRLAHVVGCDHRVVELDLDVVLAISIADFLVAHRNPGRDQRPQPPDDDILLHLLFKLRDRHVELIGDEGGVPVGADELAVWEEELAKLAFVQKLDHIVVGGANAQLLRLCQQDLLLHQLLADALFDQAQNDRAVGVALLLQLPAGHLLHPLLAHRLARRQEAAVPVGVDHGICIGGRGALAAGQAGDQVQHHAHRGGGDDDDEKCLDYAAVFLLQETDHGWI
jgi:hypothetical protein